MAKTPAKSKAKTGAKTAPRLAAKPGLTAGGAKPPARASAPPPSKPSPPKPKTSPRGAIGGKPSAKPKSGAKPAAKPATKPAAKPASKPSASAPAPSISDGKGRFFLLDVPFAKRQEAREGGASWDGALKSWLWRGDVLPRALIPFRPPAHSRERWAEDDLNGVRKGAAAPTREIALRAHQAEAAVLIRKTRRIGRRGFLLADDVGLGKAQPDGSPVLTPRGFRPLSSLKPGDPVVDPEGGIGRVLSVHPQGVRPVLRVAFDDGTSAECDEGHLWAVEDEGGGRRIVEARALAAEIGTGPLFLPSCSAAEWSGQDGGREERFAELSAACAGARFVGGEILLRAGRKAGRAAWLARSLGLWAKIGAGGRVRVRAGGLHADLSGRRGAGRDPRRRIAAVAEAGRKSCRCVSLDTRARTYATSDFAVTHNTITAWSAILDMEDVRRILIVCPLAVCAAWRQTIGWMGDRGKRIVVTNYDRLQKLFEIEDSGGKTPATLKGKARAGKASEFDLIVWDESHRLKNPLAARTRFAMKLNAKAKFLLWLSATAGQNPLELSYLAPLLAQMTGSKASDLAEFEKWCEKEKLGVGREAFGKWTWSGGEAETKKVERLLFGGAIPAGVRRRPEEIAGWPEINRILFPVDLDADQYALYETAWKEFRETLGLGGKAKDPKNALAARLRFRQKTSLLRVDSTVALALELLESGHQAAVSVAFQETLEAIAGALESAGIPTARIHGRQGPAEKESERVAYQTGERRAVVFTVEEGISLHQGEMNEVPRSQIIHDIRWSAIQMAQIEGRSHRDGRFAQMYWMHAPGTIDDQIVEVVAGKMKVMKSMIGDDSATIEAIQAAVSGS